MIRIFITGALSAVINAFLLPVTSTIWRELVHEALLEQMASSGWLIDIAWAFTDVVFAALIMIGVGTAIAAWIVCAFATRLDGR